LQNHGPDALAYFPHGASAKYFKRLMHHLGSYVYSSPCFGQCRGPRDAGYKLTFGMNPGSVERADFEHAEAILLTGTHIGENAHTSHVRDFIQAVSRGAKLVVVDPRYSVAASKADLWLPIRPGTDIAFLLAVIRSIITEGSYDKAFVEHHCRGFEELKCSVAHATPEWAAAITDMPREKIREAARILAHARPRTLIHPGRFSAWYGNDTQRSRALAILTALLGAWGCEGGIFLPTPVKLGDLCCERAQYSEAILPRRHPFTQEGYPFQDILDASLGDGDYPVKLWFLYGSNVLHSMPSPERTARALKKLDFVFMVDILPSEPALYADVILPEATYLERYDVPLAMRHAKQPFIALRQPIVEPMYETRDPYWIARELAKRLGIEECLQCDRMEQAIDRQFAEIGTSLVEVARTGFVRGHQGKPYFGAQRPMRFRTPSGKVELYSSQLAEEGLDPIPRYEPIPHAPAGYLRLVNGRSPYHSFTRTMNNAWLTEMNPVNPVWLNDKVARRLGIRDGEEVELENQVGIRVGPIPVKVTPGIRPEIVFLTHGWGQRAPALNVANGKGASDNCLMSAYAEDAATGATGLRVNFVRLVHRGSVLEVPGFEEFGVAPEPELATLPMPLEPLEPAYVEDELAVQPPHEKANGEWDSSPEEGC
jgi:thiosulfate reductase/polysulfide reductase chain A